MADAQPPLFDDLEPRRRARTPARPPLAPAIAPYSTRECADYLGVELDFVYDAITSGHLKAEYVQQPGKSRGTHRIHHDDFVAWLKAIHWSRLPK